MILHCKFLDGRHYILKFFGNALNAQKLAAMIMENCSLLRLQKLA